MKPEDLEKRIQNQSMLSIPSEWRNEILKNAETEAFSLGKTTSPNRYSAWWREATPKHWFVAKAGELLWPNPKAWSALAATWVMILTLNFMTPKDPKRTDQNGSPDPMLSLITLQQQWQMYAELTGEIRRHSVPEPKPSIPKPQSKLPDRDANA